MGILFQIIIPVLIFFGFGFTVYSSLKTMEKMHKEVIDLLVFTNERLDELEEKCLKEE